MMHFERFFTYIPAGSNALFIHVIKHRRHSNFILMNFNKRKNKAKWREKNNQNAVFFLKGEVNGRLP